MTLNLYKLFDRSCLSELLGHNCVWHNQLLSWVTSGRFNNATLLNRPEPLQYAGVSLVVLKVLLFGYFYVTFCSLFVFLFHKE